MNFPFGCSINRSFCSNLAKKSGTTINNSEKLLNKALNVFIPRTTQELAKKLCRNVIFHKPGDVLVLEKPYGISCLGYKQSSGGVFVTSRYDQRNVNVAHLNDSDFLKKSEDDITIEKALPMVARNFKEHDLHFCVGLKRYVSGPIVLPCSVKSYQKIKESIYHANSLAYEDFRLYRALAICLENPSIKCGVISGYATFQKARDTNEYVFVQDKIATKRARSGKFALQGSMYYDVLATKNGCSLIDIHFTKFSRHMPRLMLSHLGCPILGDEIYTTRLVQIDGKPIIMEPKDRWRTSSKPYIPGRFLEAIGVETFDQIRSQLPLYLAVYQSTFPLFGDTKKTKEAELISRIPPPEHFQAMVKLLNMDFELQSVLDACQDNSEREPIFVND